MNRLTLEYIKNKMSMLHKDATETDLYGGCGLREARSWLYKQTGTYYDISTLKALSGITWYSPNSSKNVLVPYGQIICTMNRIAQTNGVVFED